MIKNIICSFVIITHIINILLLISAMLMSFLSENNTSIEDGDEEEVDNISDNNIIADMIMYGINYSNKYV